jgi:hypothetical protein
MERKQKKALRFRENAAECDRQAKRASEPQVKAQFEDLARRWRELAQQAERLAED